MARRRVSEETQARRTGYILLVLLAGFAGLGFWREHPNRAAAWAGLGAVAAVLVFAAPRVWLVVWRGWMRVALAISAGITVVILGVCYYFLFLPVGLVMRVAGRDALHVSWSRRRDSYWVAREPVDADLDRYRRQY